MPDVRNFNLICNLAEFGESGFSTTYCGYPKKSGFRGIHQTKDGSFLNSDLMHKKSFLFQEALNEISSILFSHGMNCSSSTSLMLHK